MRIFSLASSVICAVAIASPFATAQGTLPDGTYQVQNTAFDSPAFVLDLSAFNPNPGTQILLYQDNGGDNQHWNVATSGSGYTFTAVQPASHIFVDSIAAGSLLTGTPNDTTTFSLDKVGDNTYQILVGSADGVFAVQAPAEGAKQTSIEALDATNPHQVWRFVAL